MTSESTVGVIAHLPVMDLATVRGLAHQVEAAGGDWLGLPDAFWRQDTWLLVAEAARGTQRIAVGPMVTNPYLRHPFQTVAAVATAQQVAGERILVGIGAGGSEVTAAAGISRRDAPERIRALAALLRSVATGAPLDPATGRRLEVPLSNPPVVVAGRGERVLEAAGRTGDRALLWAVPVSDLDRSAQLVIAGAAGGREAPGERPELVWAPLVDHGEDERWLAGTAVGYAALNSPATLRARWGLAPRAAAELRRRIVAGVAADAAGLLPPAALRDLVLPSSDLSGAVAIVRRIGATSLAVPAFSIDRLGEKVEWARQVLSVAQRQSMAERTG